MHLHFRAWLRAGAGAHTLPTGSALEASVHFTNSTGQMLPNHVPDFNTVGASVVFTTLTVCPLCSGANMACLLYTSDAADE